MNWAVARRGRLRNLAQATLAAVLAAAVPYPAGATPQTRTGTLRITATVQLGPNVPAGATLSASAGFDVFGALKANYFVDQNISKLGTITRSGNTATITITFPYAVTFDSAQFSGARFTVGFYFSSSTVYLSASQVVPFPATGATTTVPFNLAI